MKHGRRDLLYTTGRRQHGCHFARFVVNVIIIGCQLHLCKHAATNEGMPFLGPRMAVNGLWSVMRVNFHP